MMPKSMVESVWAEDMGQILYYLDPNTRKIARRPEKLLLKIMNSVPSSLIKLAQKYIYIYIYIYIRSPMGVEHSGEGIFGRCSHNAKLFERIEHSGSR